MGEKKIQLFCMPFAGGSAAAFGELCKHLDARVAVKAVEYPGRGSRTAEAYCQIMAELVADAKRQIEAARVKKLPFALLGYSMGVEVSFDLAQYALQEKPCHVFFAAREPICYDTRGHDYALLNREQFIEKIVSFGGIDERILHNHRFLEIYLRPVFADYKLLHQYVYQADQGQLPCDMTVFYCERDTPYRQIWEWKRFAAGDTDFFEMGDNHFFIQQHAKDMADIINNKLARIINDSNEE